MGEPGSVTLKGEDKVDQDHVEMRRMDEEEGDQDHAEMRRLSQEELKQLEKAAIKKELEETEAQLEKLDEMERTHGDNQDEDMDEVLQNAGIHVLNIMEFNATLELSAPRDVSKMYNFSGVHSNLPRDDINLQFCRGQLKNKKEMLQAMMGESNRRKSLLDHQTLLTLKNAEESHLVGDKTDFWRKASIQQMKEKRPQIESNPEWLMEYKKEGFNNDQPDKVGYWNKIITTKAEEKEPKKKVHVTNEEKIKQKQEKWELSVTDDSWYRAPQFHPEVDQTRRTDIEILCEIIYAHGERYDDGTAAIGFTWLFKVYNRANTVGILIKAKKHGLVFFDGEIVFASVRSEDDDEFVVLQKPIAEIRTAFKEMRERHPDMFDVQRKGKRRQTVVLPGYDEQEDEDDSDEFLEEDEEDESL